MAQSAEYPDLKWVPPKSWTNSNRTSVQVIVVHDTEGSENATSAEDGAAYDQRRTDGTSTHYFHDQNSTVQCVLTADQAHAARANGNRIGIQHELCGVASQGAAGWADAASQGTLRQAAKQVARDCKKWNIPVRRLTSGQVAGGTKGICGHADITAAFPQDNGTHTDPGPTFPWVSFLAMVQDELEGNVMTQPYTEAQMSRFPWVFSGAPFPAGMSTASVQSEILTASRAHTLTLAAILAAVNADTDTDAILAHIDAKATELAEDIANVDEAVIAKLGDPATPDEEVAAALVSLLGDRKDAVLALMQ